MIEIPNNVKIIEKEAFKDCKELVSFRFLDDSQLQSISESMLCSTSITIIVIPKHVKVIEKRAFYMCNELKTFILFKNSELSILKDFSIDWTSDKFYITSNLKEIDHTSFYMFYNVTEISISPRNKNFLVVNKQIIIGKSDINKDEYDIVLFAAKNIQYAYIPSNIKKIGTKAFERCKYLNKIDFAKDSQLEIIDNDAFCYSSILEQICIPDNVKFIKKNAFRECKKLNKVVISNKIFLNVLKKSQM